MQASEAVAASAVGGRDHERAVAGLHAPGGAGGAQLEAVVDRRRHEGGRGWQQRAPHSLCADSVPFQ